MAVPKRAVVQAPGKVNLTLDITGTNGQGYHLLETVMQAISLSDILILHTRQEPGVTITCIHPDVPLDEANIVHKAALLFFQAAGITHTGLSIHIDKRIPTQAGLAGGSADAAGVLQGLNALFHAGLTPEQLGEIGLACGADVPFCLRGGCCLAEGIGEILTPVPPLPEGYLVVAKPPVGMSTQLAYRQYDNQRASILRPDTPAMLRALEQGDLAGAGAVLGNVFQQALPIPEVEEISHVMIGSGALGTLMSGSGTSVFGLFGEKSGALACIRELEDQVAQRFLARPIHHGPRVLHLDD